MLKQIQSCHDPALVEEVVGALAHCPGGQWLSRAAKGELNCSDWVNTYEMFLEGVELNAVVIALRAYRCFDPWSTTRLTLFKVLNSNDFFIVPKIDHPVCAVRMCPAPGCSLEIFTDSGMVRSDDFLLFLPPWEVGSASWANATAIPLSFPGTPQRPGEVEPATKPKSKSIISPASNISCDDMLVSATGQTGVMPGSAANRQLIYHAAPAPAKPSRKEEDEIAVEFATLELKEKLVLKRDELFDLLFGPMDKRAPRLIGKIWATPWTRSRFLRKVWKEARSRAGLNPNSSRGRRPDE